MSASSFRPKGRLGKVIGIVAIVSILGAGIASAVSSPPAAGLIATDASGVPKRLSHSTVSSTDRISVTGVESSQITSVVFYVDDPSGNGQPVNSATAAPFVMSPLPSLAAGIHTVLAVLTESSGKTHDLFARFNVGTSTAPTGTTVPTATSVPTSPVTTQPSTPTTPTTVPATTGPPATGGAQTLGVGGVATPAAGANVNLTTTDGTADLNISQGGSNGNPVIYDGGGHTVGTVNVSADWVTVQNFKIVASGQYGAELIGTHITFQNNDITNVHASGDGDLNAITFFGDNNSILYNTAVDFVSGDPGGSHTDAIQTWDSSSHTSSSNIVIGWNKFSGPDKNTGSPIHQCVMAEGPASTDGGGGGPGNSQDWLVIGNYFKDSWNQCLKFDDIDNVTVTGNQFDGNSDAVVDATALSSGFKFYSDNNVTGQYGSLPDITPGTGPTSL